jgi:fumarate hydratase class II
VEGQLKIGRTHMQDATPIALGEEWSGYSGRLSDNLERTEDALKGVYSLYCRFPPQVLKTGYR